MVRISREHMAYFRADTHQCPNHWHTAISHDRLGFAQSPRIHDRVDMQNGDVELIFKASVTLIMDVRIFTGSQKCRRSMRIDYALCTVANADLPQNRQKTELQTRATSVSAESDSGCGTEFFILKPLFVMTRATPLKMYNISRNSLSVTFVTRLWKFLRISRREIIIEFELSFKL